MEQYNLKRIGANLVLLREKLGITQHDLAIKIDISKRTLASIESGNSNTSFNTISKLLIFYNYKFDELDNPEFAIPKDYRRNLISFHNENNEFLHLLLKKPKLSYAISFLLSNSEYLNEQREVNEIKKYFKSEYDWDYAGTSISNALKKEKNIHAFRHPVKKGTFLYQKRQTK